MAGAAARRGAAVRSYDDHQLGAVLRTCEACRRAWYMVVPHPVCAECRGHRPHEDLPMPKVDVSGNQIHE